MVRLNNLVALDHLRHQGFLDLPLIGYQNSPLIPKLRSQGIRLDYSKHYALRISMEHLRKLLATKCSIKLKCQLRLFLRLLNENNAN